MEYPEKTAGLSQVTCKNYGYNEITSYFMFVECDNQYLTHRGGRRDRDLMVVEFTTQCLSTLKL